MNVRKVTYKTLDGHESTAYLDDEPNDNGTYRGEDKYSDESIAVRWSDINGWCQV